MNKIPIVLTVFCAALGIPLAGLMLLAGAMNTVPRFTLEDLLTSLPLVLLAVLFGGSVISRGRRAKTRIPKLVWASVIGSSLAILVLVITYLDMRYQ